MKVTVIHKAFEDKPVIVAEVEAPEDFEVDDALEYAYRWTNNVAGSWSLKEVPDYGRPKRFVTEELENGDANPNVTVLDYNEDGLGLRSTSVGDLMIENQDLYKVAGTGFERISFYDLSLKELSELRRAERRARLLNPELHIEGCHSLNWCFWDLKKEQQA